MLSDKGDHSITGIVLIVGGLKKGERLYSRCVGREKKNTFNFDTFKRMYQKKFMNLIGILFEMGRTYPNEKPHQCMLNSRVS